METDVGFIIRTRLLTETSQIVHWLSEEHGILSTVAKGALRPKSAFRGKLDLFFKCGIGFQLSRRSQLHPLREVAVENTHAALRSDLGALRQLSYAVQLIEQAAEPQTPVPEVFHLFADLVDAETSAGSSPALALRFELRLLVGLGLAPDLAQAALDAKGRQIVRTWIDAPLASALDSPSPRDLRSINQWLHGYLIYHLGKYPRARTSAIGLA